MSHQFIVLDLEATCWNDGRPRFLIEIIEIGAVKLQSASGPVIDEFDAFVQPKTSKHLSDFCIQLTSITQADIDGAEPFPAVLEKWLVWAGNDPIALCSWGAFDLNQLRADCVRHSLSFPPQITHHINIKKEFARHFKVKSMDMDAALGHVNIPLEGTHHRGIDDSRNIAKLAMMVLPPLEQSLDRFRLQV